MRPERRRQGGFTLIELLIAATILLVIVAGVVVAGNAQGRASAVGARQRLAQAQGRSAALFLERKLALAGYGMDPVFAFDFGRYAGPCPTGMDACPRDSTSNADELVFYARNPNYWVPGDGNFANAGMAADPSGNAWIIRSTSATTVTIDARPGDSFAQGQVILAVCRGGNFYAFATLSANVGPATAKGNLVLPVKGEIEGDPFNRPDLMVPPARNAACFSAGTARLFLVDRYRFHVRPVVTGAGDVVPYLMLDQGIDRNRDGAVDENDEIVVGEGIEDLQVAYQLANPALPTQTAGVTGAITFSAASAGSTSQSNGITTTVFPGGTPAQDQSVYAPSAFYTYPVGPPPGQQRLTDHQANIVAVRVALVSRSVGTDRNSMGDTFLPLNRTAVPDWVASRQVGGRDGYQRALLESTVRVPNMTSGGMPYF